MAPSPTDVQLAAVIDGLADDLAVLKVVAPMVAEHARRERWHPDGRLPANAPGVGEDLSEAPCDLDYSDPTGEAVVCARPTAPGLDTERLRAWTRDLVALTGSSRALLDQLPAVARSVRRGRPATDGRSEDERLRARTGAVEAESACQACELGVSVVGRLKGGLCHTDYTAWWRAHNTDPGLERQAWLAGRRRQLAQADGVVVAGPWADRRAGVEDVAA